MKTPYFGSHLYSSLGVLRDHRLLRTSLPSKRSPSHSLACLEELKDSEDRPAQGWSLSPCPCSIPSCPVALRQELQSLALGGLPKD